MMGFSYTLAALGVFIFARFALIIRDHFVSTRMPFQMTVISVAGLMNIGYFVVVILQKQSDISSFFLSLVLMGASYLVLTQALKETKDKKLTLAFDETLPDRIVTTGIYRIVKHPFYVSYTLFWLALIVATQSIVTVIITGVLVSIYVVAARREEAFLMGSEAGPEYAAYRKGMLI